MVKNGNGGISVVFFDLGKVILNFSHQDIVARLLSRAGPGGKRPEELFRFLFDADQGLCNLYDAGGMTSRDFHAEIDKRFGLRVPFEGFVPLWNDIFTEITEVSDLVREVRKRRPVYLLSNVNELHWEFVKTRFPVLSELDGWVLSYEVKAKKPDRAIFRAALAAAKASGGDAAFVDDMEENTRAAGEFGIHAVRFTGSSTLRTDLESLDLV